MSDTRLAASTKSNEQRWNSIVAFVATLSKKFFHARMPSELMVPTFSQSKTT